MKQTIVIKEYPQNEMQTINWYRALGWEVANNQTIVTTDVHSDANGHVTTSINQTIKLTFERDTKAPNFEILNDYYTRCLPYLQEKIYCEDTIKNVGTSKNWWTLVGTTFPLGFIIGFLYEKSQVKPGFWGGHDFDIVLAFIYSIIAIAIIFFIGLLIMDRKTKKKFRPRLQKAIEEIEKITNESAQYVE